MQSGIIEIIFLAMLAGFIGLRLYNVLGRRTGHERPVGEPYRPTAAELSQPAPNHGGREPDALLLPELPADIAPEVRPGVDEIRRADRTFNPENFVAGARGAYQMVLEAFWKGEPAELADLVSDDLFESFKAAIEERKASGETLDNRLLEVDSVRIVDAGMNGSMAEVTVQFDAEILAVTRNADGEIVNGSATESVETHDVWTFSRHVTSPDPVWLLVGTDTVA